MEQISGTVDISEKSPTARMARARTILRADPEAIRKIKDDELSKKDPIGTARAAGMLAVKNTPHTLPHCHPVDITDIKLEFEFDPEHVTIYCTVRADDRTGPELEALAGASVAALTLYDVIKSTTRDAVIEQTRLLEKTGGKSGHWKAEDEGD